MSEPSTVHPAVLSRAQGCLLGQLAGDALGGLVEFQTPEQIRQQYPEGVRRLEDGGTWGTLAGQPTDDSEMALALARTLAAGGRFDLEQVARAYASWHDSGPFDMGNTCRTALSAAARAVAQGLPAAPAAQEAASRTSQANGALMRISPLAIFGVWASEQEVMQWARDDASLTHPHPVCLAANAVFAATLSCAIRTGASPAQLYGRAVRLADDQPQAPEVRNALAQAAEAPPADFMCLRGWVCLALQNAFHQLLHAPDLEAGLVDTVGHGGDTDTNAAIAGALLGAAFGAEAIPEQWRSCLLACRPFDGDRRTAHPRPEVYWPCDALELATQLLGGLRSSEGRQGVTPCPGQGELSPSAADGPPAGGSVGAERVQHGKQPRPVRPALGQREAQLPPDQLVRPQSWPDAAGLRLLQSCRSCRDRSAVAPRRELARQNKAHRPSRRAAAPAILDPRGEMRRPRSSDGEVPLRVADGSANEPGPQSDRGHPG
jgi:ADP-ribosylglycohydrolase